MLILDVNRLRSVVVVKKRSEIFQRRPQQRRDLSNFLRGKIRFFSRFVCSLFFSRFEGKTDVAVQVISNLYHSFPNQRTIMVAHSNAALNDLFEKIMEK